MSWHPGSEMISTSATQVRTGEPALGNTIVGLQNLAVSGQPASSVQQSIENAFAMGYGLPTSTPLTMPEQSPTGHEDYHAVLEQMYRQESLYNPEPIYNPYSYNTLQQLPDSYMSQPSTQDMYPPPDYQLPQWPENQPCFNQDFPNPQTSADVCQWPSNLGHKLNGKGTAQVSKRANKVLSGIGLYDDKASDFTSGISGDPSRDSMGKGLKLEETWQPPKDEEENDDDDDDDDDDNDDDDDEEGSYSTDEAEEIEEDPPILTTVAQDAQTACYPTYGDLSQQSFFFTNDEDSYTGEDHPYSNYLALGSGQPKPQDAMTGNFLWC